VELWDAVAQSITVASGEPCTIRCTRSLGGGSISSASRIECGDGRNYFVKLNCSSGLAMFEAEADGLNELADAAAIRVPRPLCTGSGADRAWLVCEYIAFTAGQGGSPRLLGEQLAALHRHAADRFGWFRDNTIGATPQRNRRSDDWVNFFRDYRLAFQLDLAARNGFTGALQRRGERLLADLDAFFTGYAPRPSLLHGDLWGGNYSFDRAGAPVIFDPAVYYGDREADLAMTELFGGFSTDFYAAYRAVWPLDAGYAVRKTLYNLYHILNHANLFGGSYAAQAEQMIDSLLAEI